MDNVIVEIRGLYMSILSMEFQSKLHAVYLGFNSKSHSIVAVDPKALEKRVTGVHGSGKPETRGYVLPPRIKLSRYL